MKQLIIGTLMLLSISAAYAGSSMLLHVYFDSDTGIISNCDGTLDLSEGCPMPMIN